MSTSQLSRRGFTASVAALGTLALLGCERAAQSQPVAAAGAGKEPEMIVYRDPTCPCCEKWAAMARDAGYRVTVTDRNDMPAIKQRYGVPDALRSCHTAVVDGLAFEGHVPFAHVAKLLAERPEGIAGLAVAGMPIGSPGMEVEGVEPDPFEVMAFGKDGRAVPFAA